MFFSTTKSRKQYQKQPYFFVFFSWKITYYKRKSSHVLCQTCVFRFQIRMKMKCKTRGMRHSLWQFITKCDKHYYKMRQQFCYKMWQKFITKCVRFFIRKGDTFVTKCDSFYKMRRLSRIPPVQNVILLFFKLIMLPTFFSLQYHTWVCYQLLKLSKVLMDILKCSLQF